MLWRHLCQVRAWSAVGLFSGVLILAPLQAPAQSPRLEDSEPTAAPAEVVTQTVDLLKASQSGELGVVARGQGQDRAQLTIRNTSQKRLNVVLPAGLVASATAGQGRGMQSIGLGAVSNRPGGFGEFAIGRPEGLQSVNLEAVADKPSVTVPAGETLELSVPAVCLNYGLRAPTSSDTLTLMDVDDYTTNPRVRKGLRSLCRLGTSQGVAQAVMWHLCSDLSFETMAAQAGKVMNEAEIALAARFVEVLDATTGSDLVEPAALSEGRVFVRELPPPGTHGARCQERRAAGRDGPCPLHQGCSDRQQDRRDAGPDQCQLLRGLRPVGTAGQGNILRRNFAGRARWPGRLTRAGPGHRRRIRHRQTRPEDRRKHDPETREPPSLHAGPGTGQGRQLCGRTVCAF